MLEYLDHFKIIESLIIILVGSIIRIMITNSLKKIRNKFGFQKTRVLIVNRIITFLVYAAVIVLIAFIWGVDEKQLMVYVSSFLTILGIAFFAQWSILANITAGLILYINYPVKIGDTITILEKDNNITGVINDIGAFFITLTVEDGDLITLPNTVILQKNIRFKPQK
ncbi:mechanosensitive ion channel domain-containing protein [Polaribacter dokdonensis]|uniref:Mechanosensitive ion channel n=1 Tax=Polaribacter dokdonensis DSW-5 TaxID=1300348 RepID=A0A0N0CF26_9FLAO|nr:mechanosensitive ion channel domain-containing protein [Polaribacter dokdonensis]KOY51257.1 Small-conductance mechanosensitive channel [Polaribacter dokdonensis DSW-5]SEE15324.1 Mechanosensitive ion channel [Polaribacter dokdonensis DSW-5]